MTRGASGAALVAAHGVFVRGAAGRRRRVAPPRHDSVRAAVEILGARNPRIARLDASGAKALLATHWALFAAAESRVAERGAARACASRNAHDDADDDVRGTFLLVSVEHGSLAADRVFWRTAQASGGAFASPLAFAATLPSAIAGEIAMTFAFRGPSLVFTGPCGEALRVAAGVAAAPPSGITQILLVAISGGVPDDAARPLRARAVVIAVGAACVRQAGGRDVA